MPRKGLASLPSTGDTFAGEGWANFLRNVNPGLIEQERYGIPGPEEVPGSKEDRRMRAEHAARAQNLHELLRPVTAPPPDRPMTKQERAAVIAEWRAYTPEKKYERKTPRPKPASLSVTRQLEIALAAMQTKAGKK